MNKFKGTKGNWVFKRGGILNGVHCEEQQIAIVNYAEGKSKANALLISKAPEMLEMLESIVSTWDTNQNFDEEYFNNIKNLIKEATEL